MVCIIVGSQGLQNNRSHVYTAGRIIAQSKTAVRCLECQNLFDQSIAAPCTIRRHLICHTIQCKQTVGIHIRCLIVGETIAQRLYQIILVGKVCRIFTQQRQSQNQTRIIRGFQRITIVCDFILHILQISNLFLCIHSTAGAQISENRPLIVEVGLILSAQICLAMGDIILGNLQIIRSIFSGSISNHYRKLDRGAVCRIVNGCTGNRNRSCAQTIQSTGDGSCIGIGRNRFGNLYDAFFAVSPDESGLCCIIGGYGNIQINSLPLFQGIALLRYNRIGQRCLKGEYNLHILINIRIGFAGYPELCSTSFFRHNTSTMQFMEFCNLRSQIGPDHIAICGIGRSKGNVVFRSRFLIAKNDTNIAAIHAVPFLDHKGRWHMHFNSGYRNLIANDRERSRCFFIVHHCNRHIALAFINDLHLITQDTGNIGIAAFRHPCLGRNVDPLTILQALDADDTGGHTGNRIRILRIHFRSIDRNLDFRYTRRNFVNIESLGETISGYSCGDLLDSMRLILTFGIDPVSPLRFIIVISNTIAALPGKFGTKVTDLKRTFVQSGQGKSIILQFLNAAVCVFKIHIRHSGLRNGNFDGIGHIASSCGYRCLTHGFTCQQAIFINGSNTLIRNTPGNGIRCACRCQLCFQLHRGARFQRNRFTIFDRHCGCRNGLHDNLDCIRNRTDCYGNICLTFCYTSDLTGSSIHADNAIINTAPNHCICGITGRHGCLQRCTFMDTQFHFFALINFYHSCADS